MVSDLENGFKKNSGFFQILNQKLFFVFVFGETLYLFGKVILFYGKTKKRVAF